MMLTCCRVSFTQILTRTHVHTFFSHMPTYIYIYTHALTHMQQIHVHAHIHTHTYAHTHTRHTPSRARSFACFHALSQSLQRTEHSSQKVEAGHETRLESVRTECERKVREVKEVKESLEEQVRRAAVASKEQAIKHEHEVRERERQSERDCICQRVMCACLVRLSRASRVSVFLSFSWFSYLSVHVCASMHCACIAACPKEDTTTLIQYTTAGAATQHTKNGGARRHQCTCPCNSHEKRRDYPCAAAAGAGD